MSFEAHRSQVCKQDAGLSEDIWIIIMELLYQDGLTTLLLVSCLSRKFNNLATPLIWRKLTFPEASRMFDFDMHIQRTSEKLAKYTRVLEFPNSMDHWISTSTISWVITKCTRLEHFRWNNFGPGLPASLFEYILLSFPETRFHYQKEDRDYPQQHPKELLSLSFPLDKLHSFDVTIRSGVQMRDEDELKEFVEALVRCSRLQHLSLYVQQDKNQSDNRVLDHIWKDVTMMRSLTIRYPNPFDLCPLPSFGFFGSVLLELDLLTRETIEPWYGERWEYPESAMISHDDLEAIRVSCSHLRKLHVFVCLDTANRDDMINLLYRWKSLQDIRLETYGYLKYGEPYARNAYYHHVGFNIAKGFVTSVVAKTSVLQSIVIITRHRQNIWMAYDFRKYEYKGTMFGYHTYNASKDRKVTVSFKYRLDETDPIEDDVNETLISPIPDIKIPRQSIGCRFPEF